MKSLVIRQFVIALCIAGSCFAAESVDFSRDIRPILSDKCFACHGPDSENREADLRLDQRENVFASRDDDSIITPGSPEQSELIARVESDDPDIVMPPPDAGKTLSPEEVMLIRRWVDEGAEWKSHWAFVKPERPTVPVNPSSPWATNEIDHFIEKRLTQSGLSPEPIADRHQLIRRLYLDLTGLPPSSDEIRQFAVDESDKAYERLVDRLLDSPHYGERMTTAWLDQARYADTNGYSIDGGRHMWLWRDWVINAYNTNLPFDQFVVEQLAGDLLPDATIHQKVATGFNRNHMITHEGGTIPEENLVNYAADRVRTTAEVFLGLTMGCAQCHDHKFDPITQVDYYRFFAYFNTLDDRGLDGDGGRNASPTIKATSILGRDGKEVESLRRELAELKDQLAKPNTNQVAWEDRIRRELDERGRDFELHPVEVIKVTSPNRGSAYDVLDDGTVFVPNGSGRSPSISARIDRENITGVRIVFYPDERFPHQGIGHGRRDGFKGSLLLTSFSASANSVPSDQVDLYRIIPIRNVTASNSHSDYPPDGCLDPRDFTGWSPGHHVNDEQHITFQFEQPINASETPFITTMLVWGGGDGLTGGKYRIFAMTGNDPDTNIPADIEAIVGTNRSDRSHTERIRLREHFAATARETSNIRYQIQNLEERLAHFTESQPVMIMNESEKPRETFILNRGQYDQPTVAVSCGTPDQIGNLGTEYPSNRLGLAMWLVDKDHPLTSRVAVNRLWQLLFGAGLVSTSADFGSQGQPPSHPELLDWLATEFIASGWDVKAMLKRIVMSSTYRQRSFVSFGKQKADPNNRLLSRGARFRLDGEFIRDAALKTSGLLSPRIGGPSVKPYQPFGLWREISHFGSTPATAQAFVQDHGDRLYRRSIYTYWKRTVPPPSMVTFDAPNREVCTIQRSRTNTPLQALVQLNDPQFVEASRAFAARILNSDCSSEKERIELAFLEGVSRLPNDAEIKIVRRLLNRETERYRATPSAADEHLAIGESDVTAASRIEHAAWTTVARLVLNLSESITKN